MIKKTLKINGVERILILDKDETLAQVLREHLLLTGFNARVLVRAPVIPLHA